MTQDKIIEVLNLAINSLKNTARRLETHNDLYINAIQGCYAVLNEVSKPTPSQSEPVGELILDPMFLPTMKVPLVDWKINLTSLDIGTNFYTKPQPTSQDAERLRYLYSYYCAIGQLVDTPYDDWIANIEAMKESKLLTAIERAGDAWHHTSQWQYANEGANDERIELDKINALIDKLAELERPTPSQSAPVVK